MEYAATETNQRKALKENTSLFDLLALLIIGVVGMTISLFGLEANDPLVYSLGLVILFAIAGSATLKFLTNLRDFILDSIDQIKKRRKNN